MCVFCLSVCCILFPYIHLCIYLFIYLFILKALAAEGSRTQKRCNFFLFLLYLIYVVHLCICLIYFSPNYLLMYLLIYLSIHLFIDLFTYFLILIALAAGGSRTPSSAHFDSIYFITYLCRLSIYLLYLFSIHLCMYVSMYVFVFFCFLF